MKHISICFFIFSIFVPSIVYPALEPRQEFPVFQQPLPLPSPPLPQDPPLTIRPPLQPAPSSLVSKIAGLAGSVWSWSKTDTTPRYVCPKHNLPLHLSDTQSHNKACREQHALFPQNAHEAYLAQCLQDKQRGLPPLPDPALSRQPVDPKAWQIPLKRDRCGHIQGLGGETEQQRIASLSTSIQQKYKESLSDHNESTWLSWLWPTEQSVSSQEFNAQVQALTKSAQESAKTGSPEVLHNTIAETLSPIRHTIENEVTPEQKGNIGKIQTRLANLAWDRSRIGDFAGSLHAASTSIRIDQATRETGLTLYTRSTDKLVQDVMVVHSNHALAKATGMDTAHPEVAKKMIFGGHDERLYLAPYVQDKLNLPPRLHALVRGVAKGAYNFADGIKELVSHPVATIEKIILSAAKIGGIIDHYITGDFVLTRQRERLTQEQAHRKLAAWEQQELVRVLKELKSRENMPTLHSTWSAARNLSSEDITTLASSLTSPEGLEKFSQMTTELGLGILTGKIFGGIFGDTVALLEEINPLLFPAGLACDGATVALASDSAAIAAEVGVLAEAADIAAIAEVGIPTSQIALRALDDKEPSQRVEHTTPVRIYENNAQHIFRDAEGHISDTPANRKLLTDMASKHSNFLGEDKYNNKWFAQTLPKGEQLWAEVRNGMIRDGGINQIPRAYNPETGLKNPIIPRNKT